MKLNEKIIRSLGLKETADTAATSRCGEAAENPLLQIQQSLEDLFGSGGLNPSAPESSTQSASMVGTGRSYIRKIM